MLRTMVISFKVIKRLILANPIILPKVPTTTEQRIPKAAKKNIEIYLLNTMSSLFRGRLLNIISELLLSSKPQEYKTNK
jgi:hypothetical protein